MTHRPSRLSRIKRQVLVPDEQHEGKYHWEARWFEDELLDGYGLPGKLPPDDELARVDIPSRPFNSAEEVVDFIEYCLTVASSSPQAAAEAAVHKSLVTVADSFWPDLADRAGIWIDVEAREIIVETADAGYRIAVRAITKATAHDPVDAEPGSRHRGPVSWPH